jgi:hypothetical protein
LLEDAITSAAVVLVALLGAVLLFGVVTGVVLRRVRARASAAAAPPMTPHSSAHGFPVIVDEPTPAQPIGTGRGRYRVAGVVAETKVDVTLHVDADSPANAKVKAELSGVVVTDVSKEA